MRIAYLGVKGLPARGGAERVVEALAQRLTGRYPIEVLKYNNRRAEGCCESSVSDV